MTNCKYLLLQMKKQGMSQRKLSEKSGVTPEAISHYLKGRHIPMYQTALKLAYALNVDVNNLEFRLGARDAIEILQKMYDSGEYDEVHSAALNMAIGTISAHNKIARQRYLRQKEKK